MSKNKSSNLISVKNGNIERLKFIKEQHIDKDLTKIFISSSTYILPKLIDISKISTDVFNKAGSFVPKLPDISNYTPAAVNDNFYKIGSFVSKLLDISNYIPTVVSDNLNKIDSFVPKLPNISNYVSEVVSNSFNKISLVMSYLPAIGYCAKSTYYMYNTAIDIIEEDYDQAQTDFYKAIFFGGASVVSFYYPFDTVVGVQTICNLYSLYEKVEAFDTVIERIELTGDKSFIFDLNTATVIV